MVSYNQFDCHFLAAFAVVGFSDTKSRVTNLLLTEFARNRTGRISALGLSCMVLAEVARPVLPRPRADILPVRPSHSVNKTDADTAMVKPAKPCTFEYLLMVTKELAASCKRRSGKRSFPIGWFRIYSNNPGCYCWCKKKRKGALAEVFPAQEQGQCFVAGTWIWIHEDLGPTKKERTAIKLWT